MVALNALFTYILKPTSDVKAVIALILLISLLVRRTQGVGQLYLKLKKIPVGISLTIILSFSFLLRLFWIFWSPHVPPAQISEDYLILNHAQDLAAGLGFRSAWTREFTAFRPIGYPLFLAFLFKLFGTNLVIAELFQAVFGVLSVFLVFYISKQTVSDHFGLFAALLYGCYPTAIMSTKILLDEHLFLVLWLASLALLISDYQKPSFVKVSLAGLTIGISALCRPYTVTMCVVVFIVWLFAKRSFTGALKRGVLVAFLTLLCALPWAIRNYYRLGVPIFYTTAVGTNCYFSNNPTSDVRYPVNPDLEHGGDPDYLRANITEVERDYAGRRAAFRWIIKNPVLFIEKALGRTFYMLGLNREGWVIDDNFTTIKPGAKRPSKKFLKGLEKFEQYYYVTVFLFSLTGLFLFCGNFVYDVERKGLIYPLVTLWFYIFLTAISLTQRKYRFVVEPFFCIFAAYGIFISFFGYWDQKSLAMKQA